MLPRKSFELTPEEMQERAERARERLEAAGEIDTLEDQQPDDAPPFNAALIGVTLEINWRYWIRTNGKRKGQLIWCEGVVVEIADAKNTQIPKAVRDRLEEKPRYAHAPRLLVVPGAPRGKRSSHAPRLVRPIP